MTTKAIVRVFVQALLLFAALTSPVQAKLNFEITTQTLTTKWTDETVTALYKFTNTGNETVTITDLASSCRCTVPVLDKKVYAPGESGELKAVFTPGDKVGPQLKIITLKTNLKEQPTIELTFKTDVPALPGLEPEALTWARGDKPAPKIISVITRPGMPIAKIEINPKASDFTATLKTVVEGKSYEITVVPPKDMTKAASLEIPVTIHCKDGSIHIRSVTATVR